MNITGKYLKVWKIEEKSNYTFLNLGDSRKDKGGKHENCTWFNCILLGEASKKTFNEGDVVEITSAQIFMEKYNDKWSPKIKIFHIEHMEGSGNNQENSTPPPSNSGNKSGFGEPPNFGNKQNGFEGEKFEDDIPF